MRAAIRTLARHLKPLNGDRSLDLEEVPDTVVTKSPLILAHEQSQSTTSALRMPAGVHKYGTSVIPRLERRL